MVNVMNEKQMKQERKVALIFDDVASIEQEPAPSSFSLQMSQRPIVTSLLSTRTCLLLELRVIYPSPATSCLPDDRGIHVFLR